MSMVSLYLKAASEALEKCDSPNYTTQPNLVEAVRALYLAVSELEDDREKSKD